MSTPALTPVTSPAATAAATAANQTVSKDEFLKLLVAQMQNQDPLQPQSDTEFVTQLAQFAQLEQSQNQTSILTTMQGLLSSQTGAQATGLVGEKVVATTTSVQVLQGQPGGPLQFSLDSAASAVTLTISDQGGNVVRTLKLGALPAGPQAIAWDGKNDGGQALPDGAYTLAATAQGATGTPVGVKAQVSGQVIGVSFQGPSPTLMLQGGGSVPLSNVIQVSK